MSPDHRFRTGIGYAAASTSPITGPSTPWNRAALRRFGTGRMSPVRCFVDSKRGCFITAWFLSEVKELDFVNLFFDHTIKRIYLVYQG